jgi:hypothetical protein
LTFSKQLEADLSLQAGLRHARADALSGGASARANSAYIALTYDWSKFQAWR